jgi:Endosomal/lysosomal potassium channel TMEM175
MDRRRHTRLSRPLLAPRPLPLEIGRSPTARLESFSDGVFAIAATLLVLNLAVDSHEKLGRQLLDLWPSYIAYAVSFLVIAIIWLNHHALIQGDLLFLERVVGVGAVTLRGDLHSGLSRDKVGEVGV